MNKIMTITGGFLLGSIAVFLLFQLESEREALLSGIGYMAGIMTVLLVAIDSIFERSE